MKTNILFFILLVFYAYNINIIAQNTEKDKSMQFLYDSHQKISISDMDKKISKKEIFQDIDFLVQTLEEVHPDLYAFVSKEKFYYLYQGMKDYVIQKDLSPLEFYRVITPLVAILRDGHTTISFLGEDIEYITAKSISIFPYQIALDSNHIRVVQDLSEESFLSSGEEIIEINGIPSSELISTLLLYQSGESNSFKIKLLEKLFNIQLYTFLGFEKEFKIKSLKGVEKTVKGKSIIQLRQQSKNTQSIPSAQTELISYQTLKPGIGLLTLRGFMMEEKKYQTILEQIFSQIKKEEIKNLIIDNRTNTGGNSLLGNLILSYLTSKQVFSFKEVKIKKSKQYQEFWHKKREDRLPPTYIEADLGELVSFPGSIIQTKVDDQLRFEGRVYLLIGPQTFSSGSVFATILKDFNLATLIGEETGGFPTHFGEIYPFDLPNSHLWVNCSVKYFIRPSGEKSTTGLLPDIEVKQSIQDKLVNKDTVLDYTIQFIEQKK